MPDGIPLEEVSFSFSKTTYHHLLMQLRLLEGRLNSDVAFRAHFLRFPSMVFRQYGIPVTAEQERELQQLALMAGRLKASAVNINFIYATDEFTAKRQIPSGQAIGKRAHKPWIFMT